MQLVKATAVFVATVVAPGVKHATGSTGFSAFLQELQNKILERISATEILERFFMALDFNKDRKDYSRQEYFSFYLYTNRIEADYL